MFGVCSRATEVGSQVDLVHDAISAAGVTIQEWMGHTELDVTMRYVHLITRDRTKRRTVRARFLVLIKEE